MNTNINAALAAKQEKTLNTKMRYDEGIMTRLEWLKMQIEKGASVTEDTKNRIDFNRIKFNRMCSYAEQEEYERKCNEKVPCYKLRLPGESSYWEITKTEYERFKQLKINNRLEYLRTEIQAERISTAEIIEMQSLVAFIDKNDVELLQWAGVEEN